MCECVCVYVSVFYIIYIYTYIYIYMYVLNIQINQYIYILTPCFYKDYAPLFPLGGAGLRVHRRRFEQLRSLQFWGKE